MADFLVGQFVVVETGYVYQVGLFLAQSDKGSPNAIGFQVTVGVGELDLDSRVAQNAKVHQTVTFRPPAGGRDTQDLPFLAGLQIAELLVRAYRPVGKRSMGRSIARV